MGGLCVIPHADHCGRTEDIISNFEASFEETKLLVMHLMALLKTVEEFSTPRFNGQRMGNRMGRAVDVEVEGIPKIGPGQIKVSRNGINLFRQHLRSVTIINFFSLGLYKFS